MKRNYLFFLLLFFSTLAHGQLSINEVMSNNQNSFPDNDGDYSDWIEIYNDGPSSVNLNGYYLSDNPDSMQKWRIPSIVLNSGSFTIIWCSGKNKFGTNKHTNFSIDSQGETIFLSDPSLNVVDNISPTILPPDITYGRLPNGSSNLGLLSTPTFKTSNNTTTFLSGTINDPPLFNLPGGFYISPQQISLTHSDPSAVIHYTLDGSDPTENSPVYSGPISIQSRIGEPNYYSLIRTCYKVHFFLPDWNPPASEVFKCSIIRARAFRTGYSPGPIQTYSYFIDPSIYSRYGNLPVVSIVSDPKNLFNDTTGIYVPGINYQPGTFLANYYESWDRPANIEMYVPGGMNAFNGNFKISINGQSSPSSPQKGINVNASVDFGPAKINYPLFKTTDNRVNHIQKFDKIKFRAWGSDRNYALFRDAYCESFMTKSDLDIEAYRPVVVFIDGEYWGIQEMRERNRNPEYYESHYLINKKNPGFDILDGSGNIVLYGDAIHWDAMINFINQNSMSNPADYNYIKSQMDVHSFMLNYLHSIYFARGDWPDQNEGKWRPHTPNGKWKWMQWDMDNSVAYYLNPWYDMFNLVINGSRGYGPSELFNNLMQSDEFKTDFINLMADYMNTEFLPQLAQYKVDQMRNELLPYFSEFQDRWQENYNWQNQTDSMKWWVNLRPQFIKQQIQNTFNSPSVRNLQLDVSDTAKGNIKVNSILLDQNTTRLNVNTFPWTGQYFEDILVPLKAIPKPGCRFVAWLPANDTNQEIKINLTQDTSIIALFDIDPNYVYLLPPVINEVMSSNATAITDNYGDFDDWLEIYNPNGDSIDLAGYYLTDNFVLPTRFQLAVGSDSTKIPPHGFLLVWIDDDIDQGILHANFKFNSTGDFIALIDPNGETIVDSLRFQSLLPDVSYGCVYDAATQFTTFQPSTPGATNAAIVIPENLYINELQTMNFSTIQDNYGEYNQWIEIYNPNLDTVDLAGWKITDDPSGVNGYTFSLNNDSTKISPQGFKLLWSDFDLSQGVFHLNFSLLQSGCVWLYKTQNILSDSICYSGLTLDHSYGRITDGNPTWMHFSIPTPDSNNADLSVNISYNSENEGLFAFPNPVGDQWVYFNQEITFTLFDLVGRKLAFSSKQTHFDFSPYEKGLYFIRTNKGEIIRIVRD
jgi:hypothetical protein